MASFTTEQTLPITFSIKDGRGRPAQVDGEPVAASSDETVATVDTPVKGADGSWSMNVASVAPGTARVSVTADANVSPEVTEIVGFLDVEVTLDPRTEARIVELVAGTPTDEA